MPQPMDHYATLGLHPRAEDVVVQAAWRALLRKYHPDTNRAPDADARTHAINQAYAVLSDPQARWIYDRNQAPRLAALAGDARRRRARRRIGLMLTMLLLIASVGGFHLLAPADAARLQNRTIDQIVAFVKKLRAARDHHVPREDQPLAVNID